MEPVLLNESERRKAGLSPLFGKWSHTFSFAPVPHADGGSKLRVFQDKIQEATLGLKWLYSHEVRVEIVLFLDVQSTLETSNTADLDNYAKAILDGLKGADGIMFDDTQVQSLTISWVDSIDGSKFCVSTHSSPDDFMLKPVEFYEMPDGLWYPQSRLVWDEGAGRSVRDIDHYFELGIVELMSSVKKRYRHALRRAGSDRLGAYQNSLLLSTKKRGFHRSRVGSDFKIHTQSDWKDRRNGWRISNSEEANDLDMQIQNLERSYCESLGIDKIQRSTKGSP